MTLPLEQLSTPSRKNPLATRRAARPPGGPRPQRQSLKALAEDSQVGKLLLGLSEGPATAESQMLSWGGGRCCGLAHGAPKEPSVLLPRAKDSGQEINEGRRRTRHFALCWIPTLDSDPGSLLRLKRSPRVPAVFQKAGRRVEACSPAFWNRLQQPRLFSWALTRQSRIWSAVWSFQINFW